MPQIAAVVLAAGNSSRMGSNKLVAELGGKPLVRIVVDNVLRSRVDPVLVVTGKHAEEVERVVPRNAVTIVRNPYFNSGMSSSIRAGVRALPKSADGALIVPGDMPAISSSLIDRMVAAFLTEQSICAACYKSVRGHPVLFARRYFPDLQALAGDTGAKSIIAANERCTFDIEATDDGPLIDIDTPEALVAFAARTK
jgi:molybdenum cofactor cytidylyltransferase